MCKVCPNNHGELCEKARAILRNNIKHNKHKGVTCNKPIQIEEKDCWTCQHPETAVFRYE